MVKELRILWHSVAPFVASGYGVVTKNVTLRLAQSYPLVISTYYGLHPGASLRISGVRVIPATEEEWGRYSVEHYIKKFNIDLPILASDFWPFRWFSLLPHSMFYGPVDSFDYSPEDITTMKSFSYFIPCSEFGARVYRKLAKREPTAVIPHGVDLNTYRPYPKEESRKLFNLKQDKFFFGIVAANSDPEPRKGWDDMFLAFSKFKEEFPSESKKWMIFAYTKPSDSRGYNLVEVAKKLNLEKHVIFPEHLPQMVGLPDLEMAKLYSCFDVLVNASRREGFCLPALEAQACGVPIIASDSSALPEIVKGHGWLVKMGDIVFTPRGWKCQRVDREDLTKKIEEAYFNKELRETYSQASIQFAQSFDWNKIVTSKWFPLLKDLTNKGLNKIA